MILKRFTYPVLVGVFAATILVFWFAMLGPTRVSGNDCDSQLVGCAIDLDSRFSSTIVLPGNGMTQTVLLPMITKACPVLFFDPFDDPTSGWPAWETNNTLGEYENGHYRVYMKKAGYWVPSVRNEFYGASGYKISVEVKNINNIDGFYGLIFDENGDGTDFWLKVFEIAPDGTYGIWQFDSRTGWELLADGFSGHINKGVDNNLLSVGWHNQSIAAYANGQMVKQINTSSMQSSSAVGVFVRSTDVPKLEVHFDNYTVENPICGLQPIAPKLSSAKIRPNGTFKPLNLETLSGEDFPGR